MTETTITLRKNYESLRVDVEARTIHRQPSPNRPWKKVGNIRGEFTVADVIKVYTNSGYERV